MRDARDLQSRCELEKLMLTRVLQVSKQTREPVRNARDLLQGFKGDLGPVRLQELLENKDSGGTFYRQTSRHANKRSLKNPESSVMERILIYT